MDEDRAQPQEQEVIGEQVQESLGIPSNSVNEDTESDGESNDPLYVQKRLKQQKRAHQRELNDLRMQMEAMQSQLQSQSQPNHEPSDLDSSDSYMDEERIAIHPQQLRQVVDQAFQHRDAKEREVREGHERQKHQEFLHNEKKEFATHLDSMSDKYDDFDDFVKDPSVPFTPHMADIAMTMPKTGPGSAGEVLYRLAKPENREELNRISALHPLHQAREMIKMSHALIDKSITEGKPTGTSRSLLTGVKNNPVINGSGITEKTSVSEIRRMQREGKTAGWRR